MNIEALQKIINQVTGDPNFWIDVTFTPGSDEPGNETPPVLEIVEMLWEESVSRAVITSSVKYKAQSLE